jgi:excinuclease ABC subunit A
VLDEPTIGLHPRDTSRLVEILDELASRGNTLVVVEHEPIVMRGAAHVVDLGPGAGAGGGRVLYAGPGGEALDRVETRTARYLRGDDIVRRDRIAGEPGAFLVVEGATQHNLKDTTVRIPFGRLTSVTGVSGSGKSSLIEDVLWRAARRALDEPTAEPPGAHRAIRGLDQLDRVVLVDQSPIGRTPRSCPLTYMGGYTALREIYARQPAAIAAGLKEGDFSFNTAGGRCERCEGAGWVTIEMYFLATCPCPCDACGGDRFRTEVLQVKYRGLDIRQALDLTVDQAFEHFANEPRFTRTLHMLRRVGLGYLKLGQPATQLSGGESQRLKIAAELSGKSTGRTLYLLDEPTVGLHYADIQRLLEVLSHLVERGDTVVVIEHNLDVIRNSDWVIDLGPDGGERGGRLGRRGPTRDDRRLRRVVDRPFPGRGHARRRPADVRPRGAPHAGRTDQPARARGSEEAREGGGATG